MMYNPNKFWNDDGSRNKEFLMECYRLNEKIKQQKIKALSPEGSKIEIYFLENSNIIDIRCDNKEVFPIDDDGYNFFYDLDDFVISNNYQDVMKKKKDELLIAIHNSSTLIQKDIKNMKNYINSIKTTKLAQSQKEQLKKLILDYKNNAKYLKKLDDAIFYAKNKILDNYNNAIIKHNKMYKEKNITNRLNPYDQNLNNIHNIENPFNNVNLPVIKQLNNKKVILPTLKNVFKGK